MPEQIEQTALNFDTLEALEVRLLEYLKTYARGKNAAKKRSEIAAIFDTSEREISQAVKNVIEISEIIICTDGTGVYMPITLEDCLDARANILARMRSLLARLRKIDRSLEREYDHRTNFSLFDLEE